MPLSYTNQPIDLQTGFYMIGTSAMGIVKNILKGQFLRSRIYSEYDYFLSAANKLKKCFLKHDNPHQHIEETFLAVKNTRY